MTHTLEATKIKYEKILSQQTPHTYISQAKNENMFS